MKVQTPTTDRESTDRQDNSPTCELAAATTDCQKQLRALYRSENALRAV